MAGNVITRQNGEVFTVTISNPARKNAATRQMFIDLGSAFQAAKSSRLLVLKGDGENFCTGADLSDEEGMSGQSPIDSRHSRSRNWPSSMAWQLAQDCHLRLDAIWSWPPKEQPFRQFSPSVGCHLILVRRGCCLDALVWPRPKNLPCSHTSLVRKRRCLWVW